MAYKPITPYRRAQSPVLPGGDKRWLEEELRKLELALQEIVRAIEELRAKVP